MNLMGKPRKFIKIINQEKDIEKYYEEKPKSGRTRIKITPEQEEYLEECFQANVYPNRKEKLVLQKNTGLPLKNIKIWLQNRRAKEKMKIQDYLEYQDKNDL